MTANHMLTPEERGVLQTSVDAMDLQHDMLRGSRVIPAVFT